MNPAEFGVMVKDKYGNRPLCSACTYGDLQGLFLSKRPYQEIMAVEGWKEEIHRLRQGMKNYSNKF